MGCWAGPYPWFFLDVSFLPFWALSLYVVFMGFCFCDGFKLHVARKLAWFAAFLIVSFRVLETTGSLDLARILPVPTLLALFLCYQEQRKKKNA